MTLDLPTLLWVMPLVSLTLAVSVLVDAWRTPAKDGLPTWGWALIALTVSYPAYALRWVGWPVASVLLFDCSASLGVALLIESVCQFQAGRSPHLPRWVIWIPVGAMALAAATLIADERLRSVCCALVIALQCLTLAWQGWSPGLGATRVRGRVLLALGALGAALAMIGLAVVFFRPPFPHGAIRGLIGAQSVFLMAVLTVELTMTLGYVLMQKDRAVAVQQDLANHDELTGAASRRALMEAIEGAVSRAARGNASLATLMIDVDQFKLINDQYGHLVGDAVLKEIVSRVTARLRTHDLLGRYGGEEFVVALEGADAHSALRVAEDIRRAVGDRPFRVDGKDIPVTVSIGAHARTPRSTPSETDEILSACDRAMYAAKNSGRNQVIMQV